MFCTKWICNEIAKKAKVYSILSLSLYQSARKNPREESLISFGNGWEVRKIKKEKQTRRERERSKAAIRRGGENPLNPTMKAAG